MRLYPATWMLFSLLTLAVASTNVAANLGTSDNQTINQGVTFTVGGTLNGLNPQRMLQNNLPFGVGVGVGYRLGDRWSFESFYFDSQLNHRNRGTVTLRSFNVDVTFNLFPWTGGWTPYLLAGAGHFVEDFHSSNYSNIAESQLNLGFGLIKGIAPNLYLTSDIRGSRSFSNDFFEGKGKFSLTWIFGSPSAPSLPPLTQDYNQEEVALIQSINAPTVIPQAPPPPPAVDIRAVNDPPVTVARNDIVTEQAQPRDINQLGTFQTEDIITSPAIPGRAFQAEALQDNNGIADPVQPIDIRQSTTQAEDIIPESNPANVAASFDSTDAMPAVNSNEAVDPFDPMYWASLEDLNDSFDVVDFDDSFQTAAAPVSTAVSVPAQVTQAQAPPSPGSLDIKGTSAIIVDDSGRILFCPENALFAVDGQVCEPDNAIDWAVGFSFDSANVGTEGLRLISKISEFLSINPSVRVRISGYTDSVGRSSYNLRLSQRRAEAVRNILINNFSINGNRIETLAQASGDPVGDNSTESGRIQNRRVGSEVIN